MRLALLAPAVPALAAGGGAPALEAPAVPRAAHTATLLVSGDVLAAGGCTADSCERDAKGATTEIYDAKSRSFRTGPPLLRPRVGHWCPPVPRRSGHRARPLLRYGDPPPRR